MSRPIKNREQFFKLLEEGLQQYFDACDRYWGGILHLTVGVKVGKVGGIIKSENMLAYEGFTLHRVEKEGGYIARNRHDQQHFYDCSLLRTHKSWPY